jgi:hypothetical protein
MEVPFTINLIKIFLEIVVCQYGNFVFSLEKNIFGKLNTCYTFPLKSFITPSPKEKAKKQILNQLAKIGRNVNEADCSA